MPDSVFGLPVHPLIVHATVVLVPLTAVLLALTLVLPRVRRWAGPLPLGLAAISVVLAPLSTSSGETLEDVVGETRLVEQHAELGEMLVWWCLGMLVVAGVSWFLRRDDKAVARGVATGLLVAGLVVSAGALVQTVLVGHSGAEAAWDGVMDNPVVDDD